MRQIYSNNFFGVDNPSSPWVSIQFRTSVNTGSINNPALWEEITKAPSNMFQNMEIEDNGGIKTIRLSLIDANYHILENIITKAIFSTKLSNKLHKVDEGKVSAEADNNKNLNWEYKINEASMANLRVRFGYSQVDSNSIDETSFGSNFEEKINTERKVIRSPWIYFMISNFEQNLTDAGLQISLNGFSVSNVFFEKVRILKREMITRSTPVDLLNYIDSIISSASDGQIRVTWSDDFERNSNIIKKDGNNKIQVDLRKGANGFRTLRSIFDEITQRIPAKIYDIEQQIQEESDGDETVRVQNAETTYNCRYAVIEKNGVTEIHFYYPNPFIKNQSLIRTYFYKKNARSIVRSAKIHSSMDLAALNMQTIIINNGDEGEVPTISLGIARSNNQQSEEQINLGSVEEVTNSLNTEQYGNVFVTEVGEIQGDVKTPAQRLMQRLISDVNNQLYKGTIELIGDPFYLFDNKFRVIETLIRLIIVKPDFEGSINEKSNLSGDYGIMKINHSISESDFTTTLEVIRVPPKPSF